MRAARNRLALTVVLAAGLMMCAAVALAAGGGRPVRGFGQGGVASLGAGTRLFGVAVQRDGKLVAVGESGSTPNLLLARLTSSGRLDRSFGRGGIVHGPVIASGRDRGSIGRAVAIAPDGKIVVAGKATDGSGSARDGLLVERYTSSGRLDRSFGSRGVVKLQGKSYGDGYAVAVARSGAVVATGSSDALGSGNGLYPRALVVRLNARGGVDRGLRGHGIDVIDLGPFSYALAVALEGSGKIVIAGSQAPGLQVTNALIARLTAGGALDRSFNGRGSYVKQYARGAAFSSFNALALAPGGKIVAAGSATAGQTSADTIVARFTGGGHPDGSFGSGGVARATSATNFVVVGTTVPGATSVAVTPAGTVLASGQEMNEVLGALTVWAFTAGGRADGGFGSHGAATLRLSSHDNSEGAAAALARGGGSIVVAGDQNPPAIAHYQGLLAAFST
jgi:uncharacterized delta-60 repeat protein